MAAAGYLVAITGDLLLAAVAEPAMAGSDSSVAGVNIGVAGNVAGQPAAAQQPGVSRLAVSGIRLAALGGWSQ